MSKILKNTTNQTVSITDTGVSIPANGQYIIPPQDYLLWAASDNIITKVGEGIVIINDGSVDLSISDGIDLLKGIFSKKSGVLAGTDLTAIGHIDDKLKVTDQDVQTILNSIAVSLGATTSSIYKYGLASVTNRNESDFTSTIYTVPFNKKFSINNFTANYDLQFTMIVRFKKQTNGTGPFETIFSIILEVGGQGQSTVPINFGNGVIIGQAGDVFKITYESTNARGNVRAFFTGNEI